MTIKVTPLNKSEECKSAALLLAEMYFNFATLNKYNCKIVESNGGYNLELDTDFDLNTEHGIHRICRLSPFDAKNRRHTSSVLVETDNTVSSCWQYQKPIRSYVFQPYVQVKDFRTMKNTKDLEAVLSGHLELIR